MTRLSDRDIVALTLWGEARGEHVEGRIAVACVLQNRLATLKWGSTYEAVCRAPYQFSCWNASDPNQPTLLAMAAQLMKGATLSDRRFKECQWIADGLLTDALQPRVGFATHYYSTSLKTAPTWAATGTFVEQVGRHRFFEGVK